MVETPWKGAITIVSDWRSYQIFFFLMYFMSRWEKLYNNPFNPWKKFTVNEFRPTCVRLPSLQKSSTSRCVAVLTQWLRVPSQPQSYSQTWEILHSAKNRKRARTKRHCKDCRCTRGLVGARTHANATYIKREHHNSYLLPGLSCCRRLYFDNMSVFRPH